MSCATRYNGTSSVMAAVTGCPAAATAQTRPAASRTVQPNQPGPMDVPQDVMDLAHYYRDMGATMYIVGGACRDHNMGKPATTTTKNGRIVSPGHAQHIEPTNQFLDAICAPKAIRAEVASLVVNHMAHIGVDVSERYVRRLSKRLQPSSIADLYALATADHFGRPPLPKRVPEKLQQILEIAQEQRVEREPIKPLVQGRHLIQLGMRPSREFGDILRSAEEAQIDGEFSTVEDGIEWLRDRLNNR